MVNKRTGAKVKPDPTEKDSVYFLKLVLFFLLGCLWLQFGNGSVPIPVGLLFGLILTSHEHFQIDRKVEYAILLIATILSFVAPVGFILNIG